MIPSKRSRALWVVAGLLAVLPACTITFREKPIEPLDPDRNYAAAIEDTWEATKQVVEQFVPEIEEANFVPGNAAGLIVTEPAVLSDEGEDFNRLRRVSFARGGGFIGGRYTLTITVRKVRGGQSKVKVVARIEGYMGEDFGYQYLRSTGIIEEEIFARISARLGMDPITDR